MAESKVNEDSRLPKKGERSRRNGENLRLNRAAPDMGESLRLKILLDETRQSGPDPLHAQPGASLDGR